MSTEKNTTVVYDCAKLIGVQPYDIELQSKDGTIIGTTIGDLYNPPEADASQLNKDLTREGIVVIQNGKNILCKSVAEFQGLDIPKNLKEYILKAGHQGIFGGQASSTGPMI